MKGLKLVALLALGALLLLPVSAFSEGEGVGEYVSEAAHCGSKPNIPLGHYGKIAKYADEFLTGPPGGGRTIYAKSLMDGIDDPAKADELGDFFVLDIRGAVDYCKGHIEGAVNVPFVEVAKPANLAMLPADKPILVVCYTGHTASQINAILNILGFDAWTLRFGMTSWNASNPTKVWSSSVSQTIIGAGYPTVPCP